MRELLIKKRHYSELFG